MFKFIKGKYKINFTPRDGKLLTTLEKEDYSENHNFVVIPPGNVFLLSNNEWKLMDTLSLSSDREYKDFLDKASHDLITILTRFPIGSSTLTFTQDQKIVLEAVGYDLVTTGELGWLGDAHLFDFVDGQMKITYDDGTTEMRKMPSEEGVTIVPFVEDDETEEKIEDEVEDETEEIIKTLPPLIKPEEKTLLVLKPLVEEKPKQQEWPPIRRKIPQPEETLEVHLVASPNLQIPSPRGISPKMPLVSSPKLEKKEDIFEAPTDEEEDLSTVEIIKEEEETDLLETPSVQSPLPIVEESEESEESEEVLPGLPVFNESITEELEDESIREETVPGLPVFNEKTEELEEDSSSLIPRSVKPESTFPPTVEYTYGDSSEEELPSLPTLNTP